MPVSERANIVEKKKTQNNEINEEVSEHFGAAAACAKSSGKKLFCGAVRCRCEDSDSGDWRSLAQ